MFKKIVKDKNLRKRYNSFEIWNKLNKSFKKSLMFYNIPKISYKGKKKYSKSFIRNYCFETGRSSGVVPFFRISRMVFREKVGQGSFIGVYK
jgi:ribosomal protein S14